MSVGHSIYSNIKKKETIQNEIPIIKFLVTYTYILFHDFETMFI